MYFKAVTLTLGRAELCTALTGKYHCPVTFKIFNENTHIVVVKTTGNVYCMEVSYM